MKANVDQSWEAAGRAFLQGFGKAFSRGDLVPQESEGMDGE